MKKISLIIICIILQSCSVSTAMKGKETPDLSAIHVGADYYTVQELLGKPDEVKTIYNGKRLHVYKDISGIKPNLRYIAPNLVLDIASLALWEFMPYHNSKLSTYYITFDKDWKIETINQYMPNNS